jgi:GNAT superfamily N-acetyltransferase
VVTDNVTFAYLTDVYVGPEHQGKGLGRWMMECLHEIINGWTDLRRFMFITSNTMDLYRKTLGAKDWNEMVTGELSIGMIEGPAAQHPHQEQQPT